MKFSDISYERPNLDAVFQTFDEIASSIQQAKNAQEVVGFYREFETQTSHLSTMMTVAHIRHTIDTRDAFYEKENEFFDEKLPMIGDKQLAIYQAILNHPSRDEIADLLSPMALEKMEIDVKAQTPQVLELMAQENALGTAYQKLYASAQIPFRGQTLTVAQLAKYKTDPDRAIRKEAFEAEGTWFDAHREEFDTLYDKLVKNRTEQARIMGYDNFIPLGAIRMRRIGYTLAQMQEYRAQIRKDVVPVVTKLKALQHHRTGVSNPKFYDDVFCFADGNPAPKGTPDEILAAGKKMYQELSPETAEFIDAMFEADLFDVLAKPGKAPGGYCTSLPDYKLPFIFSNFNGTAGDVDVLTHEAGHAFADYIAQRKEIPSILREPGMESCEIHSMAMEFLTGDYHHLFFQEDTEKYELAHAEDALFFLPYGTMVDEFQHRIYANPNMTPQERNELWASLEKEFRPWIDFADLPFYARGAGWQRQMHIYTSPFYYIDYCLAQTVALQFFTAWLKDKKDAWQRYLALVKCAATVAYPGLIAAAHFENPFESGTMLHIAQTVGEWIQQKDKELSESAS